MKSVLSGLAILFFATTANAEKGTIYDCAFKVSRGEWLADQVIFGVGGKSGKVNVYDGIIHFAVGKPIPAKVTRDDEKRFVIEWSVDVPDRHGRSGDVDFRLTFFKVNRKAVIVSDVRGYDNLDNARGRCALSKGDV